MFKILELKGAADLEFGNVRVERKVPCVLRDGVTLYADVYRPAASGEYPVLLLRQPYGRRIASTVSHAHPVWYAGQGYIVVVQDVRGRGDSDGEFIPFMHEAEDGFDTVKWAAELPESNGRVGMYGFSYQGSAQWAAASQHPPQLYAIAPSMCAADLYHGWMYPYGSFYVQSALPWAYQLARDSARRAGDTEAESYCSQVMGNPGAVLGQLPYNAGHPILEKYCPAYFDWVNRPEYDEYWARLDWMGRFLEKPVPAFHIGGWYDFLLDGTLQSYSKLEGQTRSADFFHKLDIGPWVHIPWGRKPGGKDHGPDAGGNMHVRQVQWFDYWLKGQRDNGMFEEPPIRYYERGSMEWKEAEALPDLTRGAESKPFYLSSAKTPANGALGGGRLTAAAGDIEENAAPDVFVYDARLPMQLSSWLPDDRSVQQDRPEILVYTSGSFEEPLNVIGAPKVKVSCQAMDGPTDLVAVLTMLLPDGTASFLSVGRTEIGKADGAEGISPWEEADIPMRPFAAEFPKGAALRLELTGSAFPILIRHPNGAPVRDAGSLSAADLHIATVAVSSRPGAASVVELPVR
ncbi:CocE/NonD family hydrolase [Paenibacillus caui]|uniref:CocE/NonD family hydrolase n=1 Tax=Paenibacillus caui TaxID=2873927 RepID=UPI001F00586B|nr:CocE/NonD family hydrolase [Paenibacillus caui]